MTTTGYSGTPLAKKLGIKSGSEIHLANAPANYLELVAPLPSDVTFVSQISAATDIVHVFATRRASLTVALDGFLRQLRPDGTIWVSWPKRSSGAPTDITEDVIRSVALPMGLVDIKVCAVDETWSGLKLVLRKENRAKTSRLR